MPRREPMTARGICGSGPSGELPAEQVLKPIDHSDRAATQLKKLAEQQEAEQNNGRN